MLKIFIKANFIGLQSYLISEASIEGRYDYIIFL